MKKVISLLLVIAMLMSTPVFVSAEENTAVPGVVVTADKTEVAPGDTITYTVTLTNAAAVDGGVWNYEYFLHIPQGLTLVEGTVVDTSVFTSGTFNMEDAMGTSMGRFGSGYVGGDLDLATFTCSVDADATGELTVFTYDVILADQNGVDVIGTTGSVAVYSTAVDSNVTDAGVILTADKTDVVPGDTITYTVTLTNAAAVDGGVWNYEYYLDIPAGLTLVAGTVVDTTVFTSGVFLTNLKKGTSMGRFGSGYVGGDLVLATFTCTVDEGAEGALTVSAYKVILSNQNGISLQGTTDSATVQATAGHVCTPEVVAGIPATCTSDGIRAHSKCACGKLYIDGMEVDETALIIPAMGHTEETIPGKAATCTEPGLTAGVMCSVCGEILVAQSNILVKGHKDDDNNNICDNGDHVMTGVDGDYYYVDGEISKNTPGLVEYDGAYYYVDSHGTILKDSTKWISATNQYGFSAGYYQFGTDGKMIMHDGVMGDYYYQDGNIAQGAGLVWYNGAFYYVDQSGKILKNFTKWISAVDVYDLVAGNYQFGSDGKMENFTAVVDDNYYMSGQIVKNAGLVKVGKNFYYVDQFGKVLKDTTKWISAENDYGFIAGNYAFGSAGKMEGFTAVIGDYYYKDGEITKNAGLVKVGSNFYFVDSQGKVLKNRTKWISADDKFGFAAANYQFDADGKMIFTAVIGDYYYKDGEIAENAGLTKVGKNFYYVDSQGKVLKNRTKWISANEEYGLLAGNYEFGPDGKMVMFTGVRGDYYYKNGTIAKGVGLVKFEENYYYVDQSGRVLKSTTKHLSAQMGLAKGRYLFGEDGKMVRGSGLIMVGGAYYYLKSNSTVYIGKKWISANDYGLPKGNYIFGADGKMENPPVMP